MVYFGPMSYVSVLWAWQGFGFLSLKLMGSGETPTFSVDQRIVLPVQICNFCMVWKSVKLHSPAQLSHVFGLGYVDPILSRLIIQIYLDAFTIRLNLYVHLLSINCLYNIWRRNIWYKIKIRYILSKGYLWVSLNLCCSNHSTVR